jgi:large subunit ribosomal protein L18e
MAVKSNPNTARLAGELKKIALENKAPVWKYIAEILEKPECRWAEVNVSKLDAYVKENSVVIVPGKLLGDGEIKKPVTVTAFKFSSSARKKIADAGGKIVSLPELAGENPKGSGILIIR